MVLAVIAVLVYLGLFVLLGLRCIRRGHWILFLFGVVLPFLWFVGALMPPARAQA